MSVAVVTGASKGIGAATALAFSKEGYDVVVNYKSDQSAAQQIAQTIEAQDRKALLVQADVFTETGVKSLFEATKKEFGSIDILINNAGLPEEPPFGTWTLADITKSLISNTASAIFCTQTILPLIKEGGSILFTSSIYGLNMGGNTDLILYSAGKAALSNYAESMAEKLAPRIRCNIVAPGYTKTPAWQGVKPEDMQPYLDLTLQKEWVTAEEVADAFVFLVKTPHMNAQTIVVDGGWQKKIQS